MVVHLHFLSKLLKSKCSFLQIIHVNEQTILTIFNVNCDDEGKYELNAANYAGSATAIVELKVAEVKE